MMAPQLWKNMWFCDFIETTIHMTWVPRCTAFLAGPLAASESHQAQNNSQHSNVHTVWHWVDFPSWESAWEKPLCHPQSLLLRCLRSFQCGLSLVAHGCSWLLNILKHYTQHLSLRYLMCVCSWFMIASEKSLFIQGSPDGTSFDIARCKLRRQSDSAQQR